MTLSNLRECQLFSAFDVEGVLQHDGGAGRILTEKKLKTVRQKIHTYKALSR